MNSKYLMWTCGPMVGDKAPKSLINSQPDRGRKPDECALNGVDNNVKINTEDKAHRGGDQVHKGLYSQS